MDHLELFNRLIAVARPVNASNAHAKTLEDTLKDTGLDSLDMLMIGVYLADIYGVPESIAKEANGETVGAFINYFVEKKTKSPDSVESAIKSIS
jgi:acyl carrier protein